MNNKTILGIAIAAVGVVFLAFGLNATNAPAEHITEALTGRYTDWTMRYFIFGAAAIVGGGLLTLFGRRSA